MTDFSLRTKWLSLYQSKKQAERDASDAIELAKARLTKITHNMSGMPSANSGRDSMAEGTYRLQKAQEHWMKVHNDAVIFRIRLESCISASKLNEKDTRMLVLMYLEGATQNQAAEIIGKSSAGGTYIHRRAVSALKMPAGWHEDLQ